MPWILLSPLPTTQINNSAFCFFWCFSEEAGRIQRSELLKTASSHRPYISRNRLVIPHPRALACPMSKFIEFLALFLPSEVDVRAIWHQTDSCKHRQKAALFQRSRVISVRTATRALLPTQPHLLHNDDIKFLLLSLSRNNRECVSCYFSYAYWEASWTRMRN